jgi:Zn-finger nucleic acid-binding protein
MLVVEYERIELDACGDCGGTWFDAGEIDLLMERLGIAEGERDWERLLVPCTERREVSRRCPLCRKKMSKVRMGTDGPLLDRCVRGEGLWFDRGEIGRALEAMAGSGKGAADRVLEFIREVFPAEAGTSGERAT